MDLDSFAPSGGGSLAGPAAPLSREPVATFTPTSILHPDTIWSPRGSELAPPQRPLTSAPDYYARIGAESERPVQHEHMGEAPVVGSLVADTSRTVRAALRGGIAG